VGHRVHFFWLHGRDPVSRRVGSKIQRLGLVGGEIYAQAPFLAAVALGAAGTVLVAARLGLPISTTHALTGALTGAGLVAAGFVHVNFGALGRGVMVPLLFSPAVSLLLTVTIYPLMTRLAKLVGNRDRICVDSPPRSLAGIAHGSFGAAAVQAHP
jgi:inorganic phosphate transporter, PiT family